MVKQIASAISVLVLLISSVLLGPSFVSAQTMYGCVDSTSIYRCYPNTIAGCQQLPGCRSGDSPIVVCLPMQDSSWCGQRRTYACIAANGVYSCSGDGTLAGCESSSGCTSNPRQGCGALPASLCGQNSGPPDPVTPTPGPGTPTNLNTSFKITPPSSITTLAQLIDRITGVLLTISVPIAVIMIIYAGIRMLLARGNQSEVQAAKNILWYTVLGLAIIFIGKGFVSLVTSFLDVPSITGG